jgi:hypothetical protein
MSISSSTDWRKKSLSWLGGSSEIMLNIKKQIISEERVLKRLLRKLIRFIIIGSEEID